ncbi:hypothetical protein [Streptomyces niveus]|uniref:hypothetical protein n=1 Tax=Streptomyces niveus TaxID=193462 RepID=UPI003650654F
MGVLDDGDTRRGGRRSRRFDADDASSPVCGWGDRGFTSTYEVPGEPDPRHSDSTLRFLGADRLDVFLAEAGPAVDERYGDWAGGPPGEGSPEIITVARRTPA